MVNIVFLAALVVLSFLTDGKLTAVQTQREGSV
jgi:hypothetical protein